MSSPFEIAVRTVPNHLMFFPINGGNPNDVPHDADLLVSGFGWKNVAGLVLKLDVRNTSSGTTVAKNVTINAVPNSDGFIWTATVLNADLDRGTIYQLTIRVDSGGNHMPSSQMITTRM